MITKLPDNIDPNYLIKKEIRKRYGLKCPCCGETRKFFDLGNLNVRGIEGYSVKSWYGKSYEYRKHSFMEWLEHLFEQNYHWEMTNYHCYTCGADWSTPPYPTNIMKGEEDKFWKIFYDNVL